MKYFFSATILLLLGCAYHLSGVAQERVIPKGWKQVKACDVTLLIPQKLTDAKLKNLDTCVAGFRSNDISIYVDYGNYNGATKQDETMLDFKEELITVDGKSAQVVTYLEDSDSSKKNPNRKYVTVVYIRTSEPQPDQTGRSFSLWMKVSGKSLQEQEIAKQVVSTLRF